MIRIGEFLISQQEDGNFWIQRDSGGGLEFTAEIDKMFVELF